MSLHSFDPDIAAQVGVNAAVIYQNFLFWCEKNKANKRHVMDGYVWTYNSRRALGDLFPYLTDSQIKTAIAKLVDAGLLVKGEYNLASYDRTNWYAPAVSAEWVSAIGQKSPMERSKIANGLAKNDQPIPDSKTDIKPDGKHLSCDEPDQFDEFWSQCPRKIGKDAALRAWKSALKRSDAKTIIDGMKRHAKEVQGREKQYIPHPSTWLNAGRWQDESQDAPTTSKQKATDHERMTNIATLIRKRISSAVTAVDAREAIAAGYVTKEECRGLGLV